MLVTLLKLFTENSACNVETCASSSHHCQNVNGYQGTIFNLITHTFTILQHYHNVCFLYTTFMNQFFNQFVFFQSTQSFTLFH